ncbi:hypothetical protein BCR35DRAFT_309711 [Leucosporidium creatinivorum]|uniref:Uncharacterized protein n=1 Tax=Leucosporidium creatinivorum TaxID=106004 RepID=A0A1Y2DDE4_9BASI|nr:hypothetical protein BCR35DRAFT_309711 [Leucosporidium creatinivorum]
MASAVAVGRAATRAVRPNKRTVQSSLHNTLSSLISTYHLTPTFAPLQPSQLESYILPILAPSPTIAYSARPRPSTIQDLTTCHSVLDSERIKFNSNHVAIQDLQLDLQGNRKRVRSVLDKLHGTSNGGLAGLHTIVQNRGKAVEWAQGLEQAKRSKESREREEEDELKGFNEAWEEDTRDNRL